MTTNQPAGRAGSYSYEDNLKLQTGQGLVVRGCTRKRTPMTVHRSSSTDIEVCLAP